MPRKKNSFTAALQDATKRHAEASKERNHAIIKLAELNDEIPALEETIKALKRHVGQKTDVALSQGSHTFTVEHYTSQTGQAAAESLLFTPENLTEEDTLPEPEGTPLVPEE